MSIKMCDENEDVNGTADNDEEKVEKFAVARSCDRA